MKLLCSIVCVVIFEVVVFNSSLASSIKKVVQGNRVIFTNISVNLFFSNAFKYASSKDKVLKLIRRISKEYDVDYKIVESIAKIESNFKPTATSCKGAKGIMQLVDKTAKFYGVDNPYNVEENIKGGVKFIKHLLNKYHDIRLVVAAYNSGESAVDKYKGIPPYAETRQYVNKFMEIYKGKGNIYNHFRYEHRKKEGEKLVKIGGVYTNMRCSLW